MCKVRINIYLESKEQISLHTHIDTEDLFNNGIQEFIIDKCNNNNSFRNYIISFSEAVTGRRRKPINAIFQFYVENEEMLMKTNINLINMSFPENLLNYNDDYNFDSGAMHNDLFFKDTIITLKINE